VTALHLFAFFLSILVILSIKNQLFIPSKLTAFLDLPRFLKIVALSLLFHFLFPLAFILQVSAFLLYRPVLSAFLYRLMLAFFVIYQSLHLCLLF